MLYPFKFYPVYKERIWGGSGLKKFRSDLPFDKIIGESWDISCHPEGISVISNGQYRGKKLTEIINEFGTDIIGNSLSERGMDILVKIICSEQDLSVQVHPDDEYSKKHENQLGKNECWYVMDAKPLAKLVLGTKNCDASLFEKSMNGPEIENYLEKVETQAGDVFFIKAGLVHAIGAGHMILEVQQSSDVTYRVYDYNRGRELHKKQALDVIDFSLKSECLKGEKKDLEGHTVIKYFSNKFFALEKYIISTIYQSETTPSRYEIWSCLSGRGEITYEGGESIKYSMGDSLLLPAKMGKYEISGESTFLKSYVPV